MGTARKSKRVDVRVAKRPVFTNSLFLPFQKRWIEDSNRIKLWEKSRQIGASWTAAAGDARECARSSAKHDVWVSSRDQFQSQLYISDVRRFAKVYDLVARGNRSRVLADTRNESTMQVQFAQGRVVTALGSLPDAQAGKRGHRVLDEFALNRDPKRLYAIAYPGITWGGSLSILSTHRGSGNYFNELIKEIREGGNPKKISLHSTSLTRALEEGFLDKLKTKLPDDDPRKWMTDAEYFDYTRQGCPDQETFDEEFECKPADDAAAFVEYDLITRCEYDESEPWESSFDELVQRGNPLSLGLDIGRTKDLTVFTLLEKVADLLFVRRVHVMQGETFAAQAHMLDVFMALPNLVRCNIDRNGIGMQLAEEARQKYGHRVEEVQFTLDSKAALAYPVRSAFESGGLRVPNSREYRADIHSVRKMYTEHGNVRFAGDRGANGHADRFWSLALAIAGSEEQSGFFSALVG